MKKSKFTEQQIVAIPKEVEIGAKVNATCRKYGISDAIYYKWKSAYAGLAVSQLRQLRDLQAEMPVNATTGQSLKRYKPAWRSIQGMVSV